MGFLSRLAKQTATRAIDRALDRIFPIGRVQSDWLGGSGPENEDLASASTLRGRDDLEMTQAVSTELAKKTTEEQAQGNIPDEFGKEARDNALAAGQYEKWAAKMVQKESRRHLDEENPREAVAHELPKKTDGKLIKLPPRALDGSFKLEQNLGCELPVCAANRQAVNDDAIEVISDDGVLWRLVRPTDRRLPAPEHYPYWLWFLDRCQLASEHGEQKAPAIKLDPMELFDLFGAARGGRGYEHLDEAFERFSSLLIRQRSAFVMKGKTYDDKANLGTLCFYRSWRAKPHKDQGVFEFAKGCVVPGPVLWSSVQGGYLKSIPLAPLRELGYVGQRLYTYLSKHCQPGGEFVISASKLLPKIPMSCTPDETKRQLRKHHEQLGKLGFLDAVEFDGRGKDLKLIYRRS